MIERTTLLLMYLGGTGYEVDEDSTRGRAIYEEIPPHSYWLFEDLKAVLGGLGWEIEEDQDEGPHRRLFLGRALPRT